MISSRAVIRSVAAGLDNQSVVLPWLQDLPAGLYEIDAAVDGSDLRSGFLKVIPDDCVESASINSQTISLPQESKQRCDYVSGFIVEIGTLLKAKNNILKFTIRNTGGPVGFRLERSMVPMHSVALIALWVFAFAELFFKLSGYLRIAANQRLLAVLAITICSLYFLRVPDFGFGNDDRGHVEHIDEVRKGNLVPKTRQCWECHQPPLYYWTAAVISNSFSVDSKRLPKLYQGMTLCLSLAFLLAFRFRIPAVSAGDIRYIYFSVIPFAIIVGRVYESTKTPILRWWIQITGYGFVAMGAIHFLLYALM